MLIIHRCGTCKQPDYWRDNAKTAGAKVDGERVPAPQRRTCCNRSVNWGPPETAPRWRTRDGKPVTEIAEPGSSTNGGFNPGFSCNCDDCWALYRELVPDAKPTRHLAAVPN